MRDGRRVYGCREITIMTTCAHGPMAPAKPPGALCQAECSRLRTVQKTARAKAAHVTALLCAASIAPDSRATAAYSGLHERQAYGSMYPWDHGSPSLACFRSRPSRRPIAAAGQARPPLAATRRRACAPGLTQSRPDRRRLGAHRGALRRLATSRCFWWARSMPCLTGYSQKARLSRGG